MVTDRPFDVVTRDGLKLLLATGYELLVRSEQDAGKEFSGWKGRWTVFAVSPTDSGERKQLASFNTATARFFKTAEGVTSLVRELGYDVVSLPLVEGREAVQPRPRT